MEARAASHVPWTVQDVSHEGSLQGENQGSGSGFWHNIKRACCPCFVRDPETIELVTPGGAININIRDDPRLSDRYINQMVSDCLSEHATDCERQRMRGPVIYSIVAGIILEQRPVFPRPSLGVTEPEPLQILKSNIVPFNEMPELPAEISREGISKECCILEEEVDDLVFCNERPYSHKKLAEYYLTSDGLDPFQIPINWQYVYKVG